MTKYVSIVGQPILFGYRNSPFITASIIDAGAITVVIGQMTIMSAIISETITVEIEK